MGENFCEFHVSMANCESFIYEYNPELALDTAASLTPCIPYRLLMTALFAHFQCTASTIRLLTRTRQILDGTAGGRNPVLTSKSNFSPASQKSTATQNLASFPGHRRNGRRRNSLATFASSNCIRMLCHGNCNISLQQTSARDTCNLSICENGAFLLVEATICCPFYY